eukprot:m.138182 g.138182  ORF g.138182 m.138182 type:complete len:227 (-) comp13531_c0_seq1:40-720(-)
MEASTASTTSNSRRRRPWFAPSTANPTPAQQTTEHQAVEFNSSQLVFEECSAEELERCETWKNNIVKHDPFVKFMLGHLDKAGCPVDTSKFFTCLNCPISGAFDQGNNEVILCANTLTSESHTATVMTHELIHAFDHCRGKIDFSNIEHLACTEIRAGSLSGDCFFTRELARGNLGFAKHHQTCVKRRAILSILAVLDVDKETATAAVEKVWDTCFKDTEPFDYIP